MNSINNTANNKKTIPKKTMGYLKFAHFIITSIQNDSATIHNLFVEKSIDDIIALVDHVLINGDQDKTINDLRKQFIHSNKTKSKPNTNTNTNPKPKTKNTKPKTKTTAADAIVADLVSLARAAETPVDDETPVVETPVVDETPVVETPVVETPVVDETPVVETPVVDETPVVVETPVKTPKKSRVKKPIVLQETQESIVQESIVQESIVQESIVQETIVQESNESIVQETIVQETPIVTKKSKPRVKKTA
jgi:hypothetical protein